MNLIEVKSLKLKEEKPLIPYNVVLRSCFNLHCHCHSFNGFSFSSISRVTYVTYFCAVSEARI